MRHQSQHRSSLRHAARTDASDEYAWLRADNWQEVFRDPAALDPEIRAHLEAENAYQDALWRTRKRCAKTLFQEMKGRIKEDDSSVPMPDGPFAYGTSSRPAASSRAFSAEPRDGGDGRILLDGDAEAEGKAYFRIGGVDHSARSPPLGLGLRRQGLGILHAEVRVTSTSGSDLADDHHRHRRVGRMGGPMNGLLLHPRSTRTTGRRRYSTTQSATDMQDDRLVYEETDPGLLRRMSAGRATTIGFSSAINDHETSEYRVARRQDPRGGAEAGRGTRDRPCNTIWRKAATSSSS